MEGACSEAIAARCRPERVVIGTGRLSVRYRHDRLPQAACSHHLIPTMQTIIRTLAVAATLLATSVHAQATTETGKGGGGSPHVKTAWAIGGANISIEYGRPSLKGRAEATMMPAGTPWRTGADEATVLVTDKPITFGTVKLAPGSYTLNTEPGTTGWHLLVGKLGAPKQWGIPYKKELEIGRTPMKLGKTAVPVEMVTYSIDKADKGGTLRIEWGTVRATAPFVIGS